MSSKCTIDFPRSERTSWLSMFRRNEPIVLPAIPRFLLSNVDIAHITYDKHIEIVLPLRIAPSAMIPSLSLTADFFVHQVRIIFCFLLKGLNLNTTCFILLAIVLHLQIPKLPGNHHLPCQTLRCHPYS